MTHTLRTPQSSCTHCGYLFDAVSNIEGETGPSPGDWTLCLRCAGAMVFDADLRPAMPAPGAYEALERTEPGLFFVLQRHRAAVLALAKTHPIPDRRGRAS
jgi:hypothetical protein